MGYVIAAIVLLLLVAGFITFFVLNAARRSEGAGPATPDASELGDTAEHSGETASEGRGEATGDDDRPRVGDPGPEATQPESERLADRTR